MLVEHQRMNSVVQAMAATSSRGLAVEEFMMSDFKIGDEPAMVASDYGENAATTTTTTNETSITSTTRHDDPNALILSREEIHTIAELDSRQVGFIDLKSPEETRRRNLVIKAVQHLEKQLIAARESDDDENASKSRSASIDPKVFCKLGHLNLLLGDNAKALSAYQRFMKLKDDHWKDSSFSYGLAIVYFHFGAFSWASKLFSQTLYVDPAFPCANEVHIRLGMIYKQNKDFSAALKHFNCALNDSAPCTKSKVQLKFYIAHLHENQGKFKAAKELYLKLAEDPDLPLDVKADTYRQLGWMHHTTESLGDAQERDELAVRYLQMAVEAEPRNGQTLYLLGRCYSAMGRIHEAFTAYRRSVDCSEASADTWCSIGLLYQQQNQHVDAMQAYICASQLDRTHYPAWTNLGILYESVNQPQDALNAYTHALEAERDRRGVSADSGVSVNASLESRVQFLKSQLAQAPLPTSPPKTKMLRSLEEAWNKQVSVDLTNRLLQQQQKWQQQKVNNHEDDGPTAAKRFRSSEHLMTPSEPPTSALHTRPIVAPFAHPHHNFQQPQQQQQPVIQQQQQPVPPYYLNQQQMQHLQYLQQNQAHLNPQQIQMLHQLQNQYRMMQQHQQEMRQRQLQQQQLQQQQQQQQQQQRMMYQNGYSNQDGYQVYNNQQMPPQQPVDQWQQQPQQPQPSQDNSMVDAITDQEIQAMLSQKDVASSLAEDIMKQISAGMPEELAAVVESSLKQELSASENIQVKTEPGEPEERTTATTAVDVKDLIAGIQGSDDEDKDDDSSSSSGDEKVKKENEEPSEIKDEKKAKLILTLKLNKVKKESPVMSINMSGSEVLAAVRSKSKKKRKHGGKNPYPSTMSILSERCRPPRPPSPPKVELTEEDLLPPTPSVHIENKKEAFSPALQEYCLKHPIAVVRNLCSTLKMDLGLFSTRTLVEAHPEHSIEVRTQMYQTSDENFDSQTGKRSWRCLSHRGHTTIAKYAQYQAQSFQDALKEECLQGPPTSAAAVGKKGRTAPVQGPACANSLLKSSGPGSNRRKVIKFGTNVDLSDDKKWKPQLTELMKLPSFCRVVSAGNMLSHVGHTILGMNTVQLYMKVPGSRTPGHQENNNYCSININIGPGDCEWFGVPEAYWGELARICEKSGVPYLHGSWWPLMEDMKAAKIPVYRFLQKPGELVWVNAGCIHWVQAKGWCNNIAWNVGPLTAKQYQLAVERYEYNKLEHFKSIVPMIHLSWNLARNIKVSDVGLYEQLKYCMLRTLRHCQMVLEYLYDLDVQVRYRGRDKKETTHYCSQCELEVFCVLLVTEEDGKHVVYCLDCARRQSPNLEGFVGLLEYHMDDLVKIYDDFKPPEAAKAASVPLHIT